MLNYSVAELRSILNCYYINVTYFLCGFVVEHAIHSHNLRAKSMSENDVS